MIKTISSEYSMTKYFPVFSLREKLIFFLLNICVEIWNSTCSILKTQVTNFYKKLLRQTLQYYEFVCARVRMYACSEASKAVGALKLFIFSHILLIHSTGSHYSKKKKKEYKNLLLQIALDNNFPLVSQFKNSFSHLLCLSIWGEDEHITMWLWF